MNHSSATSLVGNKSMISNRESPFRQNLPGALCLCFAMTASLITEALHPDNSDGVKGFSLVLSIWELHR